MSQAEELLAHAAWVRRLAAGLVADPQRVDDLVQDTWVAALEADPRRARDQRAWLAGVVRNLFRQRSRKDARRARREVAREPGGPAPSTDELVGRAELHAKLVHAVLGLEEPYRSTLLLRYFEELAPGEIARRHGLQGSTVRNRLRRGLEQLRAKLDREWDGSREAWCALVAPLAGTTGRVVPEAVAVTAATIAGASVMNPKVWIPLAAALAVGGALTYVALSPDADAPDEVLARSPELEPQDAIVSQSGMRAGQRAPAGEPAPARAPGLSGRVVDELGAPVPGARVFVGAHTNLFGDEASAIASEDREWIREGEGEWREIDAESARREGLLRGRLVATDDEGRFAVDVPAGASVFARPASRPGLRAGEGQGRWFAAPEAAVEFSVTRLPTSTVDVSVRDLATRAPVPGLRGYWAREGADEVRFDARSGSVEHTFELAPGGDPLVRFVVETPEWARTEREIALGAGRSEIVVEVDSGVGLAGSVAAADGTPLAGALVYWGDALRMRRDSPFGAYSPDRVPDAVRTSADGSFQLPGSGTEVTAWHADHSPLTVAPERGTPIRLPARGHVEGVVVDPGGAPVAGERVSLDGREQAVETDGEGRFRFDAVEAGIHALRSETLRFLVLRVPAGETLVVPELERRDAHAGVVAFGAPFDGEMGGVGFGLAPVASLFEFGIREAQFTPPPLVAGAYVVMGRGKLAKFEAGDATLDLGDASLEVRAPAGAAVYLVPEIDDELVRFYGRILDREVEPGTRTFSPLQRGRYAIGVHGRGIVTTVDVAGPGTVVEIE